MSIPRETFSKLTPLPYLLTHLAPHKIRPNGREPTQSRDAHIQTGSLANCHGSAVVRTGGSSIVCGIRGEILNREDIPNLNEEAPHENENKDEIETLNLLVPNVDLNIGSGPPSAPAQTISYRILSLLLAAGVIDPRDLRIFCKIPRTGGDSKSTEEDTPGMVVLKAHWTLYIDIICLSLDGDPFPAAVAATLAALGDVKLPIMDWDLDRQGLVCGDAATASLRVKAWPVPFTFVGVKEWVLADPDAFEVGVCKEGVTVTVDVSSGRVVRVEKGGGEMIGFEGLGECVRLAKEGAQVWRGILGV
ncbi:ribosomal protein S5 domain 2-like protein [Piedraia hortae CBS 480.64]|uniref:Ribosomal RNA-processing protein 43 n=1 Tax=Piedraia hortae CBS 480.64 TaxID=1314780 RepID=A0A6A7C055_9PEZI|nr:ribosomal protein S5 domain 2-like protein [Piedraia hortae CBS 480.64]